MEKFLKRFFAACLCLLIPFAFTACGKNKHKEHTFSAEWASNDTHHWHDCSYEDCDETDEYAEHTWNDGVVVGHDVTYTCTGCGKTKLQTTEHSKDTSVWSKDDNEHWHACSTDGCDQKFDADEHTWNDGVVSGHKTTYTCTVCGATKFTGKSCEPTLEWLKDENYHWHACAIEGCEEKVNQAVHTWNDGEVVGHYVVRTCTICSQTKQEKSPCSYNSAEWLSDDEYHWQPCVIDRCELISEKVAHTFDEGLISGHDIVYTCTTCGRTKSVRNDCVALINWLSDETHHWHACEVSGCNEKLDYSEHSWNDGVVNGHYQVYTCTVCDQIKAERNDCQISEKWDLDPEYHWHACEILGCEEVYEKGTHTWNQGTEVDGNFVYACTVCGYERTECGNCDYSTDWSKNETHHWHACVNEGCTGSSDKAEHEWSDNVQVINHNNVYTCTVCGYEKLERVEHNYSQNWTNDETHHWHECTVDGCNEVDKKVDHHFSEATVVDHKNVFVCTACGYEKIGEELDHDFNGAEWSSDETHHWHGCTVDGCNEVDLKEDHNYTEELTNGDKVSQICLTCGYERVLSYKNIYIRTLEQLANGDYKIKLTNFSLVTEKPLSIDLAEFYIGRDENENVVGHGSCIVKDTETGTVLSESVGVIQDGILYVLGNTDTEYYFVYKVDDILNYVSTSLQLSTGLPVSFEEIVELLTSIKTEFTEELNSLLAWLDETYPLDRENVNDMIHSVVSTLFNFQEEDDVYTYTLNFENLKKAVNFLNENTISQIIDLIYGENTYEGLQEYVISSVNKTIGELLEEFKEYGFDVKQTLAYLDEVSARLYKYLVPQVETQDVSNDDQEEVVITFETLLNLMFNMELSDLDLVIDQCSELTIVDIVNIMGARNVEEGKEFIPYTSAQIKTMISSMFDDLDQWTVYDAAEYVIQMIIMSTQDPDNYPDYEVSVSSEEIEMPTLYDNILGLINMLERASTIYYQTAKDGTLIVASISIDLPIMQGTLELTNDISTEFDYDFYMTKFNSVVDKLDSIIITEDMLPTEFDNNKIKVSRTEVDGYVYVTYIIDVLNENSEEDDYYSLNKNYCKLDFVFDLDGNFVGYSLSKDYGYIVTSPNYSYGNQQQLTVNYTHNLENFVSVSIGCGDWIYVTFNDVNGYVVETYARIYGVDDIDISYYANIGVFAFWYNTVTKEIEIMPFEELTNEYYSIHYCNNLVEVKEDRVETEYGYLAHFVCTVCGRDFYRQDSTKTLDSEIVELIREEFNKYCEENQIVDEISFEELTIVNMDENIYYTFQENDWYSLDIPDGSVLAGEVLTTFYIDGTQYLINYYTHII